MNKTEKAKIEVLQKLREAAGNSDTEVAHVNADEALCVFLVKIGFKDVAETYDAVARWYA